MPTGIRSIAPMIVALAACLGSGNIGLSAEAAQPASDTPPAEQKPVDFAQDVRPLLARRCFHCHGPETGEGGLQLHERKLALAELDSGSHGIVPGNIEESELLRRVGSQEDYERMPPEGKPLTAEEIDLLRRWIAEGAAWQKHWAFEPLQAADPPEVNSAAWSANGIDRFILRRLEQAGLSPAPPAEKAVLVRRLYYDLIGLPPTPEEVQAFVADDSPDAYERLVDRLLASPHYGERWARHWLDLVRYADTNSFERDADKPNAWRFRDYVIRSLNDDKPYDRFVLEQLAGDELPQRTSETIIATGYYRLGLWDDEPADPLQARYDELDDLVSTTGQVFLGLTINCARCHDHKIDPIPQTDYYGLLAFFQEVPPFGKRANPAEYNQVDISPPDVQRIAREIESKQRDVLARLLAIEEAAIRKMPGVDQRKAETLQRKKLLAEKLHQFLSADELATYGQLQQELEALKKEMPKRTMALALTGCDPSPPPTTVMQRGNPHVPGEPVEPHFPEVLTSAAPSIVPPSGDATTTGRRLALARWIVAPDNPLPARVMVNRIWQHHFGRGLVRSSNNFGLLGDPPTHPELIDWLAARFAAEGWRLKPLHRLMVLSSTYRMSSRASEAELAADPANHLFWRFNMRRLSAEEIRDSVLAASGNLNLEMHGPSVYPTLSDEVLATQSKPGEGWGTSSLEQQARRSIYIYVKRSLITPMMADFDFADTDSSCPERFVTTQPGQALALLNGHWMHEQAEVLAQRLRHEAGSAPRDQVARAYWLVTCREPESQEIERGLELIDRLQTEHKLSADEALKYFCLMALNLNEFVYLD